MIPERPAKGLRGSSRSRVIAAAAFGCPAVLFLADMAGEPWSTTVRLGLPCAGVAALVVIAVLSARRTRGKSLSNALRPMWPLFLLMMVCIPALLLFQLGYSTAAVIAIGGGLALLGLAALVSRDDSARSSNRPGANELAALACFGIAAIMLTGVFAPPSVAVWVVMLGPPVFIVVMLVGFARYARSRHQGGGA